MSKLHTNQARTKQADLRLEELYIHGRVDASATAPELVLASTMNTISMATSALPSIII